MKLPLDEAGKDMAENTQWSRPECQTWTVALLLGTCLLYCTRMSVPICTVAMSQDFGWNKKEAGIVLSSFFWGYCLTQVVGGHLGDRIGGEKVIMLSASAWGSITAATPLFSHLGSAHLIYVTLFRVLMGLLQGVYFPALTSLLSQKVQESERALTYSTVSAGSQIGTLVTGAVGSVLLEWCGWPSVFYLSGGLTLLWVWCMHRYLLSDKGNGPGWAGWSPHAHAGRLLLHPAVLTFSKESTRLESEERAPSAKHSAPHPVQSGSSSGAQADPWGDLQAKATKISFWPWASWREACQCPGTARYPGDSSSESLLSGQPSSRSCPLPAPSSPSSPGCPPSLRKPSPTPRAGSSTWCPGWWQFLPVCSAGFSLIISSVRLCWVGPTPEDTGVCSRLIGPLCGLLPSGYRAVMVRKFMQVMGLGLSSIFALCLGHTSSFFKSMVFASASIGLQTFNHSISVNIQDLAPSCAGFLFGVANTAGALAGVMGVCLGGYLIETTGSWTSLFYLVAIVSNLGLCTFLVFGQAQRVDLSPTHEDL
ncbi:solute carrier family 17 member 9 isoform X2 [Nycticebus coucang]|uniref:solute carrier family 17 member 9 isoform X2 n=1 Tax=Nycticebus coucang TaxID=9470 RepID=UPI00234CAADB|nr:solute carrier family 17 member 9 isoform X2 [Nycticebus coucang]